MQNSKGRFFLLLSAALSWWTLLLSEVSGGLVGLAVGIFLLGPFLVRDKQFLRSFLIAGVVFCSITSLYLAIDYSYVEKALLFNLGFKKGTVFFLSVATFLLLAVKLFPSFSVGTRKYFNIKMLFFLQGVLCLSSFVLLYCYPWDVGILYEASQILHSNISDSFGTFRIVIWRNVWTLIPANLLFGTGPDTLEFPLSLMFESTLASGFTLKSPIDVAHNEYLNMLANTGLISLISYLVALAYSFVTLTVKRNREMGLLLLGLPLICYCAQAFFGISQCHVASFLWIIFGILQNLFKNREEVEKC